MSISITKKAWSKVRNILRKSENQLGFLYSANSGGCNGFNFQLTLLDEDTHKKLTNMKYHTVLEENGSHVYVDTMSEIFLQGTRIDYIQEDITKGQFESKFVFDVDKDLMNSCGCGISFSLKS